MDTMPLYSDSTGRLFTDAAMSKSAGLRLHCHPDGEEHVLVAVALAEHKTIRQEREEAGLPPLQPSR